MSAFRDSVESQWYSRPHWLLLLAPFTFIFVVLSYLRRQHYRRTPLTTIPAPVIVVGNISVGGTGKTPVIVALAQYFTSLGYRPGVVTRGYGANIQKTQLVSPQSDPAEVGDEPVFIAKVTACPVVAGINRVESAQYLLEHTPCDLILSDDGLQHYALARDVEIAVVDSQRLLGNGWRLPVGPLREPKERLQEVDFVIVNGRKTSVSWLPQSHTFYAEIQPSAWCNVKTGKIIALNELNIENAKAIAGIGNPKRFFSRLKKMGVKGRCRAFPDHYPYSKNDLKSIKGTLLMTEKDAVKCKSFAKDDWWALAVNLVIDESFFECLLKKVQGEK